MIITLTGINYKKIQCAALFASRDSTRYILNSVCVERVSGNEVRYVGCDGRRLAVILDVATAADGNEVPEFEPFLIPVTLIKTARGLARKKLLSLIYDTTTRRVEVADAAGYMGYSYKAPEGNYPRWQAVLPTDAPTQGKAVGLSGRLLEDFSTAARMLTPEKDTLVITPYGSADEEYPNQPRLFMIGMSQYRGFCGIIMPVRMDDFRHATVPEWVRPAATKTEAPQPTPAPAAQATAEAASI